MEKLPAELKEKATAIANGEKTTVGRCEIEAIPAYNTTEDRKKYHPQGRDNGYVLTVDGSRVYIAGDTEDIPEMRALKGHRHRLRADEPALHDGHRPGEFGGGGVQAGGRLSLSLQGQRPAGFRRQGEGGRGGGRGGAGKLVRVRTAPPFKSVLRRALPGVAGVRMVGKKNAKKSPLLRFLTLSLASLRAFRRGARLRC